MNAKCLFGMHTWSDCLSITCGRQRDKNGAWPTICETCSQCGKTRQKRGTLLDQRQESSQCKPTHDALVAQEAVDIYDSEKGKDLVGMIKDPGLLAKIAREARMKSIAECALEKITDEPTLSRLVVLPAFFAEATLGSHERRGVAPHTIASICRRITDERVLTYIARVAEQQLVRLGAARQLADRELATQIAIDWDWSKNDSENHITRTDSNSCLENYIRECADQESLGKMAKHAKAAEVRRSATNRLTDKITLKWLAVNDPDKGYRWITSEILGTWDDSWRGNDIINYTPSVSQIAKKRLQEIEHEEAHLAGQETLKAIEAALPAADLDLTAIIKGHSNLPGYSPIIARLAAVRRLRDKAFLNEIAMGRVALGTWKIAGPFPKKVIVVALDGDASYESYVGKLIETEGDPGSDPELRSDTLAAFLCRMYAVEKLNDQAFSSICTLAEAELKEQFVAFSLLFRMAKLLPKAKNNCEVALNKIMEAYLQKTGKDIYDALVT